MHAVYKINHAIPPGLQLKLTQFAMENASVEIFWVDREARIRYANHYACKLLGYRKSEILRLSIPDVDPNYPMEHWGQHWQSLVRDKTQTFETLHRRRDGTLFPVAVVANYVRHDGHEYNVGFATDISKRRRAEDALREKEEFFRMITESADDFVAVLDLEGRRMYNNPSYGNLFGSIKNLQGTDSFREIHPDDRERIKELFKKTVQTGLGHRTEFRFLLPDGSIRHMESSGALIKDSSGNPLRVIVVSHDITERKQVESEIHELAFYDALTKLPNRRLLCDRLEQIMALSQRSGLHNALMFLDLDNFKPVNDIYGHDAGDALLTEVSTRLRHCVRETDTVARFGGDEFMVLLNELDKDMTEAAGKAALVADKISDSLARPYLINVRNNGADATIEHRCTTSIGVMMFLNHHYTADEIISCADKAMYQAKESGHSRVRFYVGMEGMGIVEPGLGDAHAV